MSELISPVTLANELARRVMAMVTAEDRDRGVEYDPNELLQWSATWLSERLPLAESDTIESLAFGLCEAFFADGGATTDDSPSADDTLWSLRDEYVLACQKEAERKEAAEAEV